MGFGKARHGTAGMASRGKIRLGRAGFGRRGKASLGPAGPGSVRFGMAG